MNEERKIETEEVEAVPTPPRARVTPEFERKRDYLAGFLAGENEEDGERNGENPKEPPLLRFHVSHWTPR